MQNHGFDAVMRGRFFLLKPDVDRPSNNITMLNIVRPSGCDNLMKHVSLCKARQLQGEISHYMTLSKNDETLRKNICSPCGDPIDQVIGNHTLFRKKTTTAPSLKQVFGFGTTKPRKIIVKIPNLVMYVYLVLNISYFSQLASLTPKDKKVLQVACFFQNFPIETG